MWFLRFIGLFGKGMHVIMKQKIEIHDPFSDDERIVDLGGGGEGVIGILRKNQVTAIDIRKNELDDIPDGPVKVVADARELPFEDAQFDAATAFFFFMYVTQKDRVKVIKEAYRVLGEGGSLYIWDVIIPIKYKSKKKLFVVPVKIKLPDKMISTAYGTRWEDSSMGCDEIIKVAESVGFILEDKNIIGQTFYLQLKR